MYDFVVQTTNDKNKKSITIEESWAKYFNGTRVVLDDDECKQFLRTYYGQEYVNKFDYFEYGAHKADLFRYAWLYKYGGVYCDIKTVLIRPLNEVFPDETVSYFVFTNTTRYDYPRIYNGVIATPPNNPLIYEMLQGAMRYDNREHYITICRHGYRVIASYIHQNVIPKGRISLDDQHIPDIHMYIEELNRDCNGYFDRHGFCNYIVNEQGDRMIFVRDVSYFNTTYLQRIKSTFNNIYYRYRFQFVVFCILTYILFKRGIFRKTL